MAQDLTRCRNISHLRSLNFNPAARRRENTTLNRTRGLGTTVERTIISSRYTRHTLKFSPLITRSINRLNVAGAPANPNSITRNRNVPYLVMKVVLSHSLHPSGPDGTPSGGRAWRNISRRSLRQGTYRFSAGVRVLLAGPRSDGGNQCRTAAIRLSSSPGRRSMFIH